MKERPILFSAPMVRAILAGTKTQTRRVVKISSKKLVFDLDRAWPDGWQNSQYLHVPYQHVDDAPDSTSTRVSCPYGTIGDRLWVRETWGRFNGCGTLAYRATNDENPTGSPEKWRPSIHMPRTVSRIDLEVTGVRVERLQDISDQDAVAEGIEKMGNARVLNFIPASPIWRSPDPNLSPCTNAKHSYRMLWESINGPGSWNANPWVWVVEFRRIDHADQA
jgi:hypothetical protein